MTTLTIELVNGRPALFLTQELLERLRARTGDSVQVEAAPGVARVSSPSSAAHQIEVARQVMADDHDALAVAREVMDRRRDALERLAQ